MWIERVVAHAFGPFQGEALELGPGLTLIVGPNEVGKSTWHAALRAALGGIRRGRGRATAADAAFEAQYRPWDQPERWAVEARLHLDDGRTIEISQDLADKIACRAIDVGVGRDVSDEIMDGTPDASRWLGLDRDAFAATICVEQAEILAIARRETADGLQEHMQRAASTRGTDATAAEARERIGEFRRAHVGVDRAGARGPLRAAKERVQRLEALLSEARQRHDEYLEACATADAARRHAETLAERVRLAEAALATDAAEAARRRADRAEQLAARHPAPPRAASHRAADADAVAGALEAWASRPDPDTLEGPTSAELEASLTALPAFPEGDTEPHPSVTAARRRMEIAAAALDLHGSHAALPEAVGAPVRPGGGSALRWGSAIAAAAAILGATGAALWGLVLVAAVLVLAAAGLVLLALFDPRGRAADRERLAMLAAARARMEEWELRRSALEATHQSARIALVEALEGREVAVTGDPIIAATGYEEACRERAGAAALAGRREGLRQALTMRRAAEASVGEQRLALVRAESALRSAARLVGIQDADLAAPEQLVEGLRDWRRRRDEEWRRHEAELAEWQELTALLDGRPLEALRDEAKRRGAIADEKRASIGDADVASLRGRDDLEQLVGLEREELANGRREADGLAGALEQMRRDIPDVAEAEEALGEAREELERVDRLAGVLDETLRRLRVAEEQVHRDLAPVLADGIRRWLSRVTGGAYVEASVDPADLAVKVKETATGRWRSALLLSRGTREQIYLLLRAAIAQSLVTTAETAPLLLDEVTAQADPRRTEQLLEVLRALSLERQVVVFTHDERVAAWAERSLNAPRDRIVRLATRRPRDVAASVGVAVSAR